MKLIVTATDFSEVAENATHYACQLAVAQNARLVIIHSFLFPVMFSDVPMPSSLISDVETDSEGQMKITVHNLQQAYPALDIQGTVIDGDIISALEKYSEQNQEPWLVVLGNSMAAEHASSIDSIVISAFRLMKYPVLAIPPGAVFKPVKKICLAFDNKHEGNAKALTQLKDIAMAFSAELEVLNLQIDVFNRDNMTDIDEAAINILAPANPHFHIIYDVNNIENAITDFVDKNNVDWLIMIPRKHSFFEGLFHKSHSTAMAHKSHIPIVALHETSVQDTAPSPLQQAQDDKGEDEVV